MVVINHLKENFSKYLLSFLAIHSVFAQMMEKGKTKVKTVFNLYHQNSSDGDQVIDGRGREEANVLEPMIFIDHQINEDTAISGQIVFDAWTAASDTKLDNYTGASGQPIMGQTRISANVGARQEKKVGPNKWNYGFNLGFSSEYDYQSLNASINASRSFAKDNFTLGASIQLYKDELSLFRSLSSPTTAVIDEGLKRNIMAASITASQILTVKDLIQFDLTFAKSDGFLESTANTINVAGIRKLESLPETRSRYALSSKWIHGLSQLSALHLSYRYYWDQWDVGAHTFRAAYLFDIEEDESFIELFARFHTQSEVEYFRPNFSVSRPYMTSDSDMEDFSSYEGGLFYEKELGDRNIFSIDLEDISLTQSIVYSQRTTGLRFGYYQLGLGFSF